LAPKKNSSNSFKSSSSSASENRISPHQFPRYPTVSSFRKSKY